MASFSAFFAIPEHFLAFASKLPRNICVSRVSFKQAESVKSVPLPQIAVKRGREAPPGFPHRLTITDDSSLATYGTQNALNALIQKLLEERSAIMLPDTNLSTCGQKILIEKAQLWQFDILESIFEGTANAPKCFLLKKDNRRVLVAIKVNSEIGKDELMKYIIDATDVLEIDLSWAKGAFTEAELKHILLVDEETKEWLHNRLIDEAKVKILKICEPIDGSGQGVAHSYAACPITSDSVQDMDCLYCDYRIEDEIIIDNETCNCGVCFGKSGVRTYQDLLSVTDVKKEDGKIISISYNRNGETVTKVFDKEVKLPGKTIFQLWDERTGDKLVAHNIYSNWYVLVEENPKISFEGTGKVYAKLGRNVEELESSPIRSIFSFDSCCWKEIKGEG